MPRRAHPWDWSLVADAGDRFENFVACQLLKYCHFIENTEGYPMELRYLRDTDKREVDFVVLKQNKPIFAVECKISDKEILSSLFYFLERTRISAMYLVHLDKKDFEHATALVRVLPFHAFARDLKLP